MTDANKQNETEEISKLLTEEAFQKDPSLVEAFEKSGMTYTEFFEKVISADAVLTESKTMEDFENEKLEKEKQDSQSKIEEVQKDEAKTEEAGQPSQEDNEPDTGHRKSGSGKYVALKRFFVRSSKGRRVVEIGEEIDFSELQAENISDGLVKEI